MLINLVNYEQNLGINGILSKYAQKMWEELTRLGHKVLITGLPGKADINHHINYRSYKPSGGIDTLMVTHVWEGDKLDCLKEGMKTAKLGICFSKETEDKFSYLGPMATVLPAHDNRKRRPRLVYIPTNAYPDGCKREQMLDGLLKEFSEDFQFVIMGKNWKVPCQVIDHFDLEVHHEILKRADYCLYFGLDEGSMGILDATQAGVRTIAPLQGFHHEIGIDYPFNTQEELNEIFKKLAYNPVAHLTWERYAKEHLKLWEKLL
jgi:hypothetical protein